MLLELRSIKSETGKVKSLQHGNWHGRGDEHPLTKWVLLFPQKSDLFVWRIKICISSLTLSIIMSFFLQLAPCLLTCCSCCFLPPSAVQTSPSPDHSFHLCSVVVMTVALQMCPAGPHKPLPWASETPLIFLRGVWPFKLINRSRCANRSHHIPRPRMHFQFFPLLTGELWIHSHVSSCVALVSPLLSSSSPRCLTVWVWSVTC